MTRNQNWRLHLTDEELMRALHELGGGNYLLIARRGGKFIGVGRFAFTYGLMIGMSIDEPYERRYCFEQPVDAFAAFARHDGGDGHAFGPWIKVKGKLNGQWLDELGPGALA